MKEHTITTLRLLLEIHSASIQEKMALQNLDANSADWRNWQDVVTLSGRRKKVLSVELGIAIEAIELTSLNVNRVRKFIVTQVSKNEGKRAGPMLTIQHVRFNKVSNASYVVSPLEISRAKPSFDVIDRPASIRSTPQRKAAETIVKKHSNVVLDLKDEIINKPSVDSIKRFEKLLTERRFEADVKWSFWSEILKAQPDNNTIRAIWLNLAGNYGYDAYGMRGTEYTSWKDYGKRESSVEIFNKGTVSRDEMLSGAHLLGVHLKITGNHSTWISEEINYPDRDVSFELALYYTIQATWNAPGTMGELLKDDCKRLSKFFKSLGPNRPPRRFRLPPLDPWSQV